MVAVAAVAVTIVALMRPHPIGGMAVRGIGVVWWSDGTTTKGAIPVPTNLRTFGPILKAEWSDGTMSWYLGRSARADDGYRREVALRQAAALAGGGPVSRRKAAADWIALHADLIPPGDVVPALVTAAHDPNPTVRLSVVSALAGFLERSPPAVTATAGALKDDAAVVRVAAAHALGTIGPEAGRVRAAAIPPLTVALEDGRDSVRRSAARSLVALGAAQNTDPAIIKALQGQNR
jgi:hypothetical protein